jgi:predicted porin
MGDVCQLTIRRFVGAALFAPIALAHAQSSMTLYGSIDAAVEYASRTVSPSGQVMGHTFALTDAGWVPSLIGLMGKEDLGGGLSATFDLESGIDIANGGFNSSNGNFFGRQAWVGLEGNFGRVRFGEQFSPLFLAIFDTDPRNLSTFGSGLVPYGNNVAFTSAVNSNAISYTSPKIDGFEGTAMFALGGIAGNFQAGKQWSVGAKYDNGTVMVNATIYDGNGGGMPTPVPTTVEFLGRQLGAAWRLGALTAKASFVSYKVSGGFDANVYGGGLDYFVRPELDIDSGAWFTSDRNDTANRSVLVAIGATYSVSKRTAVYAQFGVVNNHGKMNTGLSVTNPAVFNEGPGTTIGANVGFRQTF